jgi:hypothetical protein
MDDREYKKQMDEIENKPKEKKKPKEKLQLEASRSSIILESTEKPKKKSKKEKPPPVEISESEPESESETDEKPSSESIVSSVVIPEDSEMSYDGLFDASDDGADCRNLSKSTIQKRMKRNIREYKAAKVKLNSTKVSKITYPMLLANYKTAKTAARRYERMFLDFEKNEKKKNLVISEEQAFLNELDEDSDDLAPEPKSHIIRDDDTGVEYSLNDFLYTSKKSSSSTDFDENPLTAGQIKQIEIELKLYLGVSEGWIQKPPTDEEDNEDEEFDHYRSQSKNQPDCNEISKSGKILIIPPDFKELIPMIKSERQNEYPLIVKRLRTHKKLTVLASACKSNPKSVQKSLERSFQELKNLLKIE